MSASATVNLTRIGTCRRCDRHDVECADESAGELGLCQSCQGIEIGQLWPVMLQDDVDRALARVRAVRRRYPLR